MGTTTSTLSPDSETRENGELLAALQNELSAHIEYLGQQPFDRPYDLLKTQDFLAKSIASNGKFADDAWVFVENYSSEILKQQTEEKEATKRKTKNTTSDFLRSFQLQNNVLDRNDGDDGDRNFNDDDDEEEDYNSDEEEEELDLHNFPKLKDFEIIEEHIKNTECDEDYDLTEEFARLQNIRISSMNRSNNDPHHHDDHNHHNASDTHPDHDGDNEDDNHSNSHHTDDWIVVEDDPFKMALRKIEEFKAQKLAKQQQPPPPQNSSTAPSSSSVLPAMIINSYSPSPITSPRENIVDDADINNGAGHDDKNDGNDQLHSPPPPPLIISSSSASRSSSLSSDKETIKQLQEQITMLVIKIEQIEKRNNNFTHALLHRLGFDLSSSLLLSPSSPQLVNNTTTTNDSNADNEDDKNEDEEKEGDIENVHKSNYHEVHVHSIVNNIESLINNNQITVNNNLHQIPINKPEPTTEHHHLMPPLLPSPSSSPPCSSPPPPPPPPSFEQLNQPFKKRTHHHQSKNKSKEEIQNLLTIEIEQSEISDKNKKIALNNYLKCFSSPSAFQFLDFMVTYYSPLIRALPLQPKTAFELIKVWESHLFTQIEDINQRNSLRKRKMTEICLKREHDEVIEEIEKIKKFIELQKKEDEEKKRRDNLKKHFMNDLIEKLNQLNQLRADNNEDSKLELEQLEECVIDEHEIIPFTPDA